MADIIAASIAAPALGEQKRLQHQLAGNGDRVADLARLTAIGRGSARQETFAVGEEHLRQFAIDLGVGRYQTATSH